MYELNLKSDCGVGMRELTRKEQKGILWGDGSLLYLGLGGGYMGVNNCEKHIEQHLRSVHIIVCDDILIFEM